MVACSAGCTVRPLANGPPSGHIEGHLVFLNDQPAGAVATTPAPEGRRPGTIPTAGAGNSYLIPALLGAVLVLAAVLILLLRRRSRG